MTVDEEEDITSSIVLDTNVYNKDTIILSNIDSIVDTSNHPVEWATVTFWCGKEYALRTIVKDKMRYTELLVRTHQPESPELVIAVPMPNKEGMLKGMSPVVYGDCDTVLCDCNKERTWLEQVRKHTD